jgi:hypothetical protein
MHEIVDNGGFFFCFLVKAGVIGPLALCAISAGLLHLGLCLEFL